MGHALEVEVEAGAKGLPSLGGQDDGAGDGPGRATGCRGLHSSNLGGGHAWQSRGGGGDGNEQEQQANRRTATPHTTCSTNADMGKQSTSTVPIPHTRVHSTTLTPFFQ